MITDERLLSRLEKAGISAAFAEEHGVREALILDELPDFAKWPKEAVIPALVFPWVGLDGVVHEQVNPATPVVNRDGKPCKYLWASGVGAVIALPGGYEPSSAKLVLVEGTKQMLAVLRYVEDGWVVAGIGGCSNWTLEGVIHPDLGELMDGREAVVLFDSDLDRNEAVWTAALRLREAAMLLGATSIRFAKAPGAGVAGVDDFLGSMSEGRRPEVLKRLIESASAKLPPKPRGRAAKEAKSPPPAQSERPYIEVNQDRRDLVRQVLGQMVNVLDRRTLFAFGDEVSELVGATMQPVSKERLLVLAHDVTQPISHTTFGLQPAEYTTTTQKMLWSSAQRAFTPLERLSQSPFLREDGTVCNTEGYDEQSQTLLLDNLGITVPTDPTEAEIADAVKLLLVEWLGDFPFADEASRAGALALVLTPFVRGLFPLAPLAVLDGAHAGVGKGLLAEVISRMVIGSKSEPINIGETNDEAIKALHAVLRGAPELVLLDELSELKGAALASVLTAPKYKARLLGASSMAGYPNRATWLSTGNQVRLVSDMYRRCYRIAMTPAAYGHAEQHSSGFRHPNLAQWTDAHRGELQRAALTLCRAWFARDRPEPETVAMAMGSFEGWQEVVGGILAVAAVPGFLSNVIQWRDAAAEDRAAWVKHLTDLRTRFGDRPFTASRACELVLADEITDPFEFETGSNGDQAAYAKKLGLLYRTQTNVISRTGMAIRRLTVTAKGRKTQWMVEEVHSGPSGPSDPSDAGSGDGPEAQGWVSPPPTDPTTCVPDDKRFSYMHFDSHGGDDGMDPVHPVHPDDFSPKITQADWETIQSLADDD